MLSWLGCAKRASPLDQTLLEDTLEDGLGSAQESSSRCELPTGPRLAAAILGDDQVRVRDDILTRSEVAELLANVRSCSYFGENRSENSFYKGTSGFHVKFRD